MTTTQPGLEISNAQAYQARILGFLGERDPLRVLEETASTLEEIMRKHSAEVLRARPFAGKWTPNEIIGHLTDSEWVNGYRLRLVFVETR